MTHTELFALIREELNANGVHWETEKDLFPILFPNENFAFYSSNWNNWYRQRFKKIKLEYRNIIQQTIGFDGSIWDADNRTQRLVIKKAVKEFVNPPPKVDLSGLIPQNTPLDDAQIKLLLEVKNAKPQDVEKLLDTHSNYLSSTPKNQNFLLELLPLLYDKGLYDLLDQKVFPTLLPHNAEHTNIKIFKAHTFGSLRSPDYLRAASLLNSIESDAPEQLLELKTGAISNTRRYLLEKEGLTKAELTETLSVLIHYYKYAFEEIQKHHYYPGTNYIYMLKLSMLTSPDLLQIEDEELEALYKDSQASIASGSHSKSDETRYYAMISDIEFRLLLGKNHLSEHLTSWLDNHQPSTTYIERTLRMMRFFVRTVEQFGVGDVSDVLSRFREVIGILEGYMEHRSAC
jgi:hypothetical protein